LKWHRRRCRHCLLVLALLAADDVPADVAAVMPVVVASVPVPVSALVLVAVPVRWWRRR
jgi:hypothetical protein